MNYSNIFQVCSHLKLVGTLQVRLSQQSETPLRTYPDVRIKAAAAANDFCNFPTTDNATNTHIGNASGVELRNLADLIFSPLSCVSWVANLHLKLMEKTWVGVISLWVVRIDVKAQQCEKWFQTRRGIYVYPSSKLSSVNTGGAFFAGYH